MSDDILGFAQNPHVHDLTFSFKTLNLNTISLALTYKLFGIATFPLHFTSLLLHIGVAFLLFFLLIQLFDKAVATLATFLFCVHPVNVETVAWISARPYLLASALILGILNGFVFFKKQSHSTLLLVPIYLIGLVLLQEPKLLVLPFLLLLIDQFFLNKKFNGKAAIALVPYFLTGVVYAFFFLSQRIGLRVEGIGQEAIASNEPTPYLVHAPYTFYESLKLLVFPLKLTLYHDQAFVSHTLYIEMLLVFVLYFTFAVLFLKKDRKVSGLMFLIPTAFLYTFSPYQVSWFVAERYLYIASMFFVALVIYILFKLKARFSYFPNLVFITFLVLFTFYSCRTFVRNYDWSNRKRLWESALRVNPKSHRTLNNLGDVYLKEGNYQKSQEAFSMALQLNPQYADAAHNLGNLYYQLNDYENARKAFLYALQVNPALYQSSFQLALIEYHQKNFDKAREFIDTTLQLNPTFQPALELNQLLQTQTF